MAREKILIPAIDGECRSWVFTPDCGEGSRPAVIFCMDGFGIRPALLDMGQRLANAGFVVLLPDLFYRLGPYEPLDPTVIIATKEVRKALDPFLASTDNRRAAQDAASFLAYLDSRSDIVGNQVGTTGYCMGGAIALTVAATYPDRVAAAASFHGGSLATDSDLSPHLVVKDIKGRVYIGAADNDTSYPPAMAARLCEALMEASIDHCHELYVGALHGWTMTDLPIYEASAAERHWTELTRLFDDKLR